MVDTRETRVFNSLCIKGDAKVGRRKTWSQKSTYFPPRREGGTHTACFTEIIALCPDLALYLHLWLSWSRRRSHSDTEQMGTLGPHLVMGLVPDLLSVSEKIRENILKERRKKIATEKQSKGAGRKRSEACGTKGSRV